MEKINAQKVNEAKTVTEQRRNEVKGDSSMCQKKGYLFTCIVKRGQG